MACLSDVCVCRVHGASGGHCVHGTAIVWDDRAVLLVGASGAGKSATAIQCLSLGAGLVADDMVLLIPAPAGPICAAPPGAHAAIEVRGIGPVAVPLVSEARLAGIVRLISERPRRFPEPQTLRVQNVDLPLVDLPYSADLGSKLKIWARTL